MKKHRKSRKKIEKKTLEKSAGGGSSGEGSKRPKGLRAKCKYEELATPSREPERERERRRHSEYLVCGTHSQQQSSIDSRKWNV
jgi:hypothetical protein